MVCFLGDLRLLGIIVKLVLSVQMTGSLKGYITRSWSLKDVVDQTADRRQSKYRANRVKEGDRGNRMRRRRQD